MNSIRILILEGNKKKKNNMSNIVECSFCNKIYSLKEARKWKDDSWDWELDTPHTICVKNTGGYALWNKCDDSYYTGHVIEINYCPICGRKLRGEAK